MIDLLYPIKIPTYNARSWDLYLEGESAPYLINQLKAGFDQAKFVNLMLNQESAWQATGIYGDFFYTEEEYQAYLAYLLDEQPPEVKVELGEFATLTKGVLIRLVFGYRGSELNFEVGFTHKLELARGLREFAKLNLIHATLLTFPDSPFGVAPPISSLLFRV